MVTNKGLEAYASRIALSAKAVFDYIALGSGTTAAAATDTALEAEFTDSGLARVQVVPTIVTTTTANDTTQWQHKFTATATKAINEVGILNAAVAGDLATRDIVTTKNVGNGDEITVTVKAINSRA